MRSNPKIIVLKTREILYTILLLFLVGLLIVCLVLMFSGQKKDTGYTTSQTAASSPEETDTSPSSSAEEETASTYTPGIYRSAVTLGNSSADIEVTVDASHINSIRLVNLSETTAASFPLVSPSLDHITSQILEKQTLDGITCPQENRYTSQPLLSAIADAIAMARSAS